MNDGLSAKLLGPSAAGMVRAMMRDRQGSGAAKFPCHSAAERQNSAADWDDQTGFKSLVYKGYPALRGHIPRLIGIFSLTGQRSGSSRGRYNTTMTQLWCNPAPTIAAHPQSSISDGHRQVTV